MRNAGGEIVGGTQFAPVRTGGGGYVTGGGISNDGLTKVVNMDVFNAYVWGEDDTEWRPIFTPDSLQTAEYDPKPSNGSLVDASGSFAVNVSPTDKTKIVAGWNGYFYFSDDTATTLTRGNLTAKRQFSNTQSQRYWNDKIACHPTSSDTWLLGTTNDGVYYTTDFGATITAVGGTIPANSTNSSAATPYLVAFDPSNGNKAYIFVQGTGLYASLTTGATGTFAQVGSGSGPTWASHMLVHSSGTVWVVNPNGSAGARIWKWNGTVWSQPSPYNTAFPALGLAIDPADANRIIVIADANKAIVSNDGGATWLEGGGSGTPADVWQTTYPASGMLPTGTSDETVPWLKSRGMFFGKIFFNPAGSNELWGTHGLGVAVTNPPTTFTTWPWTDKTKGIEELVANNGLSVEGADFPIFGCWDKPIWLGNALDQFPSTYYSTTSDGINHCWQFDYAADDPTYIGAAMGYTSDTSGYSDGNPLVWTEYFPSGFPTGAGGGNGGAIAINERAQQIIIPGNNMRAIATEDEWATWDYLPIDPNIAGAGNWISAMFQRRNIVTADKTRPGVFAIIMSNTQGSGNQGLWVTTAGPLGTWTQMKSGRLDGNGDPGDFYSSTLAYIPGKSGELLYCTRVDATSWPNCRLLHYTSDGASGPNYLGGLTGVRNFCFGKRATPSQDYPTIYVFGKVGGVSGLYRTTDFFATTTLLERFPNNSLDNINGMFGDMNAFGRVYTGYNGSGWVYGDYADIATAN